ncbi:MAG TPA: hypothetical protein VFR96_17600, partial [Povalibacter sp.]|nr:hypothetical protein [Povalibacter sp.]
MTASPLSINEQLLALREQLRFARNTDRHKLARELDRLFSRKEPPEADVARLTQTIARSAAIVEKLRSL